MNIVVLELENETFFVEHTSRSAEEIFERHSGDENEFVFTEKNKPISFIIESTNGTWDDFEQVIFRIGYYILPHHLHILYPNTCTLGCHRSRFLKGPPTKFWLNTNFLFFWLSHQHFPCKC